MKRIIFLLAALFVFIGTVSAQTPDDIYGDPIRVESKKAKLEQKKKTEIKDSLLFLAAQDAMRRGLWVLQAEVVDFPRSAYTAHALDGDRNFVLCQGTQGIIQTAISMVHPGLNGMGGVTLEGNMSNLSFSTDRDKNLQLTYNIVGLDINADIVITVYAGSNFAQAMITPMMGGEPMTMRGRIVPYVHVFE